MAPLSESTRILIVDDDKGMVSTLSDILSACGYKISVAGSGHEAIHQAHTATPHAVLMDIRMPGLNGVDTFREMKRLAPDCYVIFMTAYATSELVEEARREGAVEVLPKPIDMELTLDLLSEIVSRIPLLVLDQEDVPPIELETDETLTSAKLDVQRAPSIEKAVLCFEKEPWRVVLLDLEVAKTVASELRILHELNPNVLIVAIGDIPKPQLAKSRSMISAYLPKDFETTDLVDMIRLVVERRAAH